MSLQGKILTDLQDLRDDMVTLPPSRPVALAITKIEECMFWLNASMGSDTVIAIWDNQKEKDK